MLSTFPPAFVLPATTPPLEPASLLPSSTKPRHTCTRGCATTFTSGYARKRHEQRQHPLPEDVKCCPTCNRNILVHLYAAHLFACVGGQITVAAPPPPLPASPPVQPASPPLLPATPPPLPASTPALDLAAVDAAFAPFITWMGVPAATLFSQKVKQSLCTTATEQRRLLVDCRNLARTCYPLLPSSFLPRFFVGALVSKPMVDALHCYHTTERQRGGGVVDEGVGHDVRYKVNLLLVKLITYLAETSQPMMEPTAFAAWIACKEGAHHASQARRLALKTRHLLAEGEPLLTAEQLHAVVRWVLAEMDKVRAEAYGRILTSTTRYHYTRCLVTALFILLNGPRAQVLQHTSISTLVLPNTVTNPTPQYEIRIGAELLKTRQAGIWVVPATLTVYLRFYLTCCLPSDYAGPLFLTERGKPRTDFGPLTAAVCYSCCGRNATPQRIRAAVVTYWNRSAMGETERRALADVMGHSVQTQEEYYVEHNRREVQAKLSAQFMHAATSKVEVPLA